LALLKLSKIRTLSLSFNQLSGPIPPGVGNLRNLNTLTFSANPLNGSIPETLGNLQSLTYLSLSGIGLTGPIPSSLGTLRFLQKLFLHNNQLTGYPKALRAAEMIIFPNPMSDVPYDVVMPASVGALSTVTWNAFLNTPVSLRKRQLISSGAIISAAELYATCPLSSITELSAGCIAGIYNKFCTNPADATLLARCHDAYNQVFSVSQFKALADVCFAWKIGPNSASCKRAVSAFTGSLSQSGITISLTSVHAEELRKNIFSSIRYAPCPISSPKCVWGYTTA